MVQGRSGRKRAGENRYAAFWERVTREDRAADSSRSGAASARPGAVGPAQSSASASAQPNASAPAQSSAAAPTPAFDAAFPSVRRAMDRGLIAVRAYGADELAALLPMPDARAHKYSRGKLTLIGGAAAYPGAVCLAAAASQRMGAGYTEVCCAEESVAVVRAFRPSLVVRAWDGLEADDFAPARIGRPAAYAVGSGMDAASKQGAEEAKRLVHAALKHAHAPVLVDGGGLSALASGKGRRLLRRRFVNGWPTVITPHAGEAARLAAPLGLPTDDPGRLACLLALAYGVVAVVKGPDTFISDGDEVVRVAEGTPALAKAGTGDVLAGMLGALLAQGRAPLDAAVLAVTLHARAGRLAAQRLTDIGVAAEDVVEFLPAAIVDVAEAPSRSDAAAQQPGLLRRLSRR